MAILYFEEVDSQFALVSFLLRAEEDFNLEDEWFDSEDYSYYLKSVCFVGEATVEEELGRLKDNYWLVQPIHS